MLCRLRRLAQSALAGLLMWAAFPDLGIWPFIVVSLGLIFGVVDRVGAWAGAGYAAIFGAVFWFPHLQWAQISANGGPLPWIALSATQVIAWAMWGGLASLVTRLPAARSVTSYSLLMATTWVGVEQIRSRFPFSGFPWGNIAFPHVDAPVGNLAPWGGETLVSFVVVCVAAALRMALSSHDLPFFTAAWWGRGAVVLTAFLLYLAPVVMPVSTAQEEGALKVAAIQGFIEPPGAKTYRIEGHVTQNHARVTRGFLTTQTPVDLIIWGEGALDRDPRINATVHQVVDEVVKDSQTPTLVGFSAFLKDRHVVHNYYGVWQPDTGLSQALYGKQIPVPFGEYIPFRSVISALATEAAQIQVDMEGVDNSSRYDVALRDGRVIPLSLGICFEVAYESLWAEGVHSGGQILVTPSNNYHFRTTPEPMQQAQMARFRALEFNRSTVQASTTGESLLIRPDGGVLAVSPRHEAAFITGELPLRSSLTWAVYTAQPLAWTVITAFVFWSVYAASLAIIHQRQAAANTRNPKKPRRRGDSQRSRNAGRPQTSSSARSSATRGGAPGRGQATRSRTP